MKKKQGISLIVLIITIIVIIILAATVILTMNNNNPISSAKEAKFKEDIRAFQDELEMYKANRIIADENVVNISATNTTNPKTQEIITSMNDEYASKLEIDNGKLVYIGKDRNEYVYSKNIGLIEADALIDDEIFIEFQPFITEWTVEAGDTITLPINGYAHNIYNFTVDYGDKTGIYTVTSFSSEEKSHTYEKAGTYRVTIKGQCPSFDFINAGVSKDKITRIVQWGSVFKNIGNDHDLGLTISFSYCVNLQGTIPEPSKNTFENVVGLSMLFRGCSSLNSEIPQNLFYNCPKITDFRWIFNASAVKGNIPENLFVNCSKATCFDFAFTDCEKLTGSLPGDLFKNCTNAISFYSIFGGCKGLTGDIPEELFANCTEVTSFYMAFDRCSGLDGSISENMFKNNLKATAFSYAFRSCTNLKGTAPELWKRDNIVSKYLCFSGCKNLSNYSDIPSSWK